MSGSYSASAVLKCLLEDPKRSDNDIAAEIGSYRQKVWRDRNKLEQENVIWGYTTIIDEHKLNRVMYIALFKGKPIEKATVDRLLKNAKDHTAIEQYKVRPISLFFVNGEYDWIFTFSAKDHTEAKRYYEYLRKEYGEFMLEKPVLIDVSFTLWREGKLNPDYEKLYEYIP